MKIPLNPPLQKGEKFGMSCFIEMLLGMFTALYPMVRIIDKLGEVGKIIKYLRVKAILLLFFL